MLVASATNESGESPIVVIVKPWRLAQPHAVGWVKELKGVSIDPPLGKKCLVVWTGASSNTGGAIW